MTGGRPLQITWRDTAEALGGAYRAERNPEVRPRLQALWLLRQGRSLSDTAAVVGAHYRTVQTWLRWYRQGGVREVRGHHQAGQGRASWLTADQQEQLVAEAAKGTFFTAQEVQQWIAEHFAVHYRRSSLYGLLARLGCRLKVPRPYNPRSTPEDQAAWKKGGLPKPSRPPG
jgi:transposase